MADFGLWLQHWCAAPGDKPAHKKLTAWILAKQVENATKAKIVGQAKKRINIAALALVRKMGVLEIIEARLPRWLDHDDRKDLVADMWTAIGLGHLLPADIPRRAKEFVSAHRKKYTNTGSMRSTRWTRRRRLITRPRASSVRPNPTGCGGRRIILRSRGLRIGLWRIFGKAIERDQTPAFWRQPASPVRRRHVADVGDRRTAELQWRRHAPAHQHHRALFADIADDGSRIIRKHAGHRGEVSDIAVDLAKQPDDGFLVRGDRIQITH
jgi:hypothetical protein